MTLDRAQRAAIRGELQMCASGWGDLAIAIAKGEREYVYRNLRQLRRIAELMDTIARRRRRAGCDAQPVTGHVGSARGQGPA